MLRYFLHVFLGPIKPAGTQAFDTLEPQTCNVVGGCGTGCLCVPDWDEALRRRRTTARNPAKANAALLRNRSPRVLDEQYWEG